jgi:branched-chain amino acid transport system ATP-binding protein
MSTPLFELDTIRAAYGPIEVLRGISLHVNEGEIVTLIGANGAGKTTTLMCASRVHPLKSGRILLGGEEVHKIPAHKLVARGLAQVPEGRKIFPRLSVLENLEMGAYLRRDKAAIAETLERVFTLFPILRDRRGQSGGTLSGGEQQMLAIGRALMSGPRVLLLDEPSMGVAPLLIARIFEAIVQLNKEGMTVLLVEQNAHMALRTASRGYIIEGGHVVLSGPSADLIGDPRVREAYLGE